MKMPPGYRGLDITFRLAFMGGQRAIPKAVQAALWDFEPGYHMAEVTVDGRLAYQKCLSWREIWPDRIVAGDFHASMRQLEAKLMPAARILCAEAARRAPVEPHSAPGGEP